MQQQPAAGEPDLLVPLRPAGTRAPLFCLPPASGSPAGYQGLAAALPGGRPVYGFTCPGFDGSRPALTSVHDIADEYARVLGGLDTGHPYHVLGWSMGAVVAFETIRRLSASHARLGTLVLVDPAAAGPSVPPTESEMAQRFLGDFLCLADSPPGIYPAGIPVATPADVMPFFEAAQHRGLIPEDLDLELIQERYLVFRANTEALAGYAPSGPYSGAVTLIKAEQAPDTTVSWKALIRDCREHWLAADHYSIMLGDGLPVLATLVEESLKAG